MSKRSTITIDGAAAQSVCEAFLAWFATRTKPRRARRPKASACRQTAIHMAHVAYAEGMRALTSLPCERAGLLIGRKGHHAVTHFVLDERGRSTPTMFEFDHVWLNAELQKYVALGMEALGVWHSHPPGCRRLSQGDLEYVRRLFLNPKNAMERVLMPVVSDGTVYPYVVDKDGNVHDAQLVLF